MEFKPTPTRADKELAPYLRPGRLVAVGGSRRLNLVAMGEGSPPVVFIAGAGGDSRNWRNVQPRIAGFTLTIAYDRAGYGYSDPNVPASASNVVEDLHALLAAAEIATPVVLVGHSAGALYATLFADRYPQAVAGLVLIDPSYAGGLGELLALHTPQELAKVQAEAAAQVKGLTETLALARAGDRQALEARTRFPVPPDTPPALKAALGEYYLQPKVYEALLAEIAATTPPPGEALSEADRAEMAEARDFGDLPMVVLGASRGFGRFAPETNARLNAAVETGRRRLAARSTRGRFTVVEGAGHWIQMERPDAVIEAVREVVDAARAG